MDTLCYAVIQFIASSTFPQFSISFKETSYLLHSLLCKELCSAPVCHSTLFRNGMLTTKNRFYTLYKCKLQTFNYSVFYDKFVDNHVLVDGKRNLISILDIKTEQSI